MAGWLEDVIEAAVDSHTGGGDIAEDWEWEGMWVALQSVYPIRVELNTIDRHNITREELLDRIFDDAISTYERARAGVGDEELMRNLERWIVLQVVDARWREHLDNMDYMRQGIGLRGYAQKDPLVEYRYEGAMMFEEMDFLVKQETVRALMHVEVEVEDDGQYRALAPAGTSS